MGLGCLFLNHTELGYSQSTDTGDWKHC